VLDLAAYQQTFVEDFDPLDVSARGPGTGWIAQGDGASANRVRGFPFAPENGALRIQ
jgi:hypothetical protein